MPGRFAKPLLALSEAEPSLLQRPLVSVYKTSLGSYTGAINISNATHSAVYTSTPHACFKCRLALSDLSVRSVGWYHSISEVLVQKARSEVNSHSLFIVDMGQKFIFCFCSKAVTITCTECEIV